MRQIVIEPVLNGFVCRVGCQLIVFTDIDTLCDELKKYAKSPEETETRYMKQAVNKQKIGGPAPPLAEVTPAGNPLTYDPHRDEIISCGRSL